MGGSPLGSRPFAFRESQRPSALPWKRSDSCQIEIVSTASPGDLFIVKGSRFRFGVELGIQLRLMPL